MGEPTLSRLLPISRVILLPKGDDRWNCSYLAIHNIVVCGRGIKPSRPGPPAIFPFSTRAQAGRRPTLHQLISIPESGAFVRQERYCLVDVILCHPERFPYHVWVWKAHTEERGYVLLLFGLHFWGVSVSQTNSNEVFGTALWLCTPPCLQSAAASLSRSDFPHNSADSGVMTTSACQELQAPHGNAHSQRTTLVNWVISVLIWCSVILTLGFLIIDVIRPNVIDKCSLQSSK